MKRTRILLLTLAVTAGPPAGALAQEDADVQAAARAFQQGQRAQLRGEHGRAGELFELADSLAPSPQALRSAIRNHRAAGNDAWAATLALTAFRRPGVDAVSRRLAEETLTELESSLGRLILRCTPACGVLVDQRATTTREGDLHELFVAPGEHEVSAAWGERHSAPQTLDVGAGDQRRASFEALPEDEPLETGDTAAAADGATATTSAQLVDEEPASGLSPAFFFVGLGLAAAAGGVYAWSLLDTLDLRDSYVEAPTKAGYEDGVAAQNRTMILGGAAAALAAGSLIVGLFLTDWSSGAAGSAPAARLTPWASEHGGGLSLTGSLGGES